jgi:hypothetical protein
MPIDTNEMYPTAQAILAQLSESEDLVALVGTRIHRNIITKQTEDPDEVMYPCVVFYRMGGMDTVVQDGTRQATRPVYRIIGVCEGDDDTPAARVANQIDKAIQTIDRESVFEDDTFIVSGCVREQPIDYSSVEDTIRYHYIGGEYRLFVCK